MPLGFLKKAGKEVLNTGKEVAKGAATGGATVLIGAVKHELEKSKNAADRVLADLYNKVDLIVHAVVKFQKRQRRIERKLDEVLKRLHEKEDER